MQYAQTFRPEYIDMDWFSDAYDITFSPLELEGNYAVLPVNRIVSWQGDIEESKVVNIRRHIQRKGMQKYLESCENYSKRYYDRCNSEYTPITVALIRPLGKWNLFNGNHRATALISMGAKYLPVYEVTDKYILDKLEEAWEKMQ